MILCAASARFFPEEVTESMRKSNFALRMQPTLMEEAREVAQAEGVALNQLINNAVAEKLGAMRTIRFFERYTRNATAEEALALLRRTRVGEPPIKGDELPASWKKRKARKRTQRKPAATRSR
jgi:HicB-like protein involved in pilus formation